MAKIEQLKAEWPLVLPEKTKECFMRALGHYELSKYFGKYSRLWAILDRRDRHLAFGRFLLHVNGTILFKHKPGKRGFLLLTDRKKLLEIPILVCGKSAKA